MLKIKTVLPHSIGEDLGLVPGDIIISLNQLPARDILDYYYHGAGEELLVRVKTVAGELIDISIEKDYDEELGLEFELKARQCQNKCVFCFIDQQPPKLRRTLYIKDDDYRLSFLHGNYITMTNLNQKDIDRVTTEVISPLYVSVHATDPDVRAALLGRPDRFEILPTMLKLKESGIAFHCQIVLCPGYNDGAVLTQTVHDLMKLQDSLLSLAVVPVGLTKFRDKLAPLKPVDAQAARAVITQIDGFQAQFLNQLGRRVIYAADEFYIRAEMPVPPAEYYEDFAQLENGIGLVRNTLMQIEEVHAAKPLRTKANKVLLVTGKAAYSTMIAAAEAVMSMFPDLQVAVRSVENRFLGAEITVAGLLAGKDILDYASKGFPEWDFMLVPEVAVRAGCFIDDYTVEQMSGLLARPVYPAGDIAELVNIIRNEVL